MNEAMNKLWMLASQAATPTGIVAIAIAIIAPIAPILYGVLFLVFVDNLTGIMAYFYGEDVNFRFWKSSSWRHIKSAKLGKSVNKSLVYMLLIISGFVIDTFIIVNTSLVFTKAFAGAVALREGKSIVENTEVIAGGGIITFIKRIFKSGLKNADTLLDEELKEKDKKE